MSNGSDIAAEIAAALAEASAAVGDGPLVVTILRNGQRSGPDNAPFIGPDLEYQVNALVGSYSAAERKDGLIEDTDIKLKISAGQGVEPTRADRVRISGNEYSVRNVVPLNPGGEALMYTLNLKA